jgi:hypothetical protein
MVWAVTPLAGHDMGYAPLFLPPLPPPHFSKRHCSSKTLRSPLSFYFLFGLKGQLWFEIRLRCFVA